MVETTKQSRGAAIMDSLDDTLKNTQSARLIPTVADSNKEERIVSTLLATLSVVQPFAVRFLKICKVQMGKTSRLYSYTEVKFPTSEKCSEGRPDGVVRLLTRKNMWTAFLEAKINKAEIDETQIHKYAEVAREYGVNAIITLSNQFVSLPTHYPYSVPKRLSNRVNFFHISWISVLTQAHLTLKDDNMGKEQEFILREMVRYFEHPGSGVRPFDEMNQEWRALVHGVRDDQKFRKSSPEIENAVASWHQEERDVCLMLSRHIGERVDVRIPRKHQADSDLRHRDICASLIESQKLRSSFIIPNAANDLEVAADLQRRTISCSMNLDAPKDRKRTTARINWLLRQLRNVEESGVTVRALWSGREAQTQTALSEIKVDSKCLESERADAVLKSFEIVIINDLAGRFSGRRTFIEDLERLIPEFYDRIGQHLRPWIPPPPPIEKRSPIKGSDVIEGDKGDSASDTPLSQLDEKSNTP